ncbi:tRNA-specific adenosine deaminase [Meridianimaribacter sp. CL38]|jgi:tRNA(Arg) A34 adenosine deaminase TadA|uniref:nucleoside deaminase n=1 Tax=Meridianimaribacter sp. CL38 TaxID=2213021 RepID=UPI00103D054E|nr:nucleoside deaminase [Meridianimaribacter sp. CL38]TBV27548.1 tRNA-specific adenosine deaminase [Meridianimaribacter sp. CL38]
MTEQDKIFMKRAIAMADKGMSSNAGGPFGCVIVKDGTIIAEGHNCVTSTNDPTAHAEVVAIRKACEALGSFQLDDCIVYTSCEPCPMCLGAIYWARPKKVYYACNKVDAANIGFDDQFIYEEIDKPITVRSIPFEQMLQDEGVTVFNKWAGKGDKTEY